MRNEIQLLATSSNILGEIHNEALVMKLFYRIQELMGKTVKEVIEDLFERRICHL